MPVPHLEVTILHAAESAAMAAKRGFFAVTRI
jgi:hypothetical protein